MSLLKCSILDHQTGCSEKCYGAEWGLSKQASFRLLIITCFWVLCMKDLIRMQIKEAVHIMISVFTWLVLVFVWSFFS